jgi:hypothetical protein
METVADYRALDHEALLTEAVAVWCDLKELEADLERLRERWKNVSNVVKERMHYIDDSGFGCPDGVIVRQGHALYEAGSQLIVRPVAPERFEPGRGRYPR